MLPNHRLGKRVLKAPSGDLAPGPPAQVEQLELQLGQATVACSAQVVGKSPLRQHPRVSALAALPPGRGEGRACQLLPAHTRYTPKDALIIPKVLWPGVVGGAEKGRVLTGQQHSQTVPADVESPELCLGLQTLLSLKVRRMLVLTPTPRA